LSQFLFCLRRRRGKKDSFTAYFRHAQTKNSKQKITVKAHQFHGTTLFQLTDEKSRVYLQGSPSEIGLNNTYAEEKNPSRGVKRLDKRQETVLKDLKAYLLAENAAEEERQRKLEEFGVSLLKDC